MTERLLLLDPRYGGFTFRVLDVHAFLGRTRLQVEVFLEHGIWRLLRL